MHWSFRIGFLKISFRWIVPVLILAGALFLRIEDPTVISENRYRVFDSYMQFKPREYDPTVPVGIIDLDDKTLQEYGQWPWPRNLVAQLVYNLAANGAAAVAFDMVFSEPDGKSLPQLMEIQMQDPAIAELLQDVDIDSLPDNDQVLADLMGQWPRVVMGFSFSSQDTGYPPTQKVGFGLLGDNPMQFLRPYTGSVTNIAEFEQAAAGVGSFNVEPESDGVIRQVSILFNYRNESLFPSLATETLRVVQGERQSIRIKSSNASGEATLDGSAVGIVKARIGKAFNVETDSLGQVMLYDTGHREERYISAGAILDGTADKSKIANRIFFVGTSAAGLKDIRSTPLENNVPGVEVHAQIAEQILTQNFLERPLWADGAEVATVLVAGLLVLVITNLFGAAWGGVASVVIIGGTIYGSWYAFGDLKLLLDPIYPGIATVVVFITSSLISYMRSEGERRQVRGAFGRYLSPALVEQLADNPDQLTLGGEMRDMTLLFADIRGFTPISEQFDPEGLTRFINRFLTPMTQIILDNQGTIDKYMGDCIMAFWSAPIVDPYHARNGVHAALRMRQELIGFNDMIKAEAEAENRKFIPVNIGIGVNSGECCVGNMGSDMRFDYSVLGDNVNLASRLEGQSKTYGVTIVIGENTFAELGDDFACLELDLIQVKGKTIPVRIYTILGAQEMRDTPAFQELAGQHDAMMQAWRRQDWYGVRDKAGALKENKLANDEHIAGLYDLYIERAAIFAETPPPADWDGVFVATSK